MEVLIALQMMLGAPLVKILMQIREHFLQLAFRVCNNIRGVAYVEKSQTIKFYLLVGGRADLLDFGSQAALLRTIYGNGVSIAS